MMYILNPPVFSIFFKFCQYLWSEFCKNTDNSVCLEALIDDHMYVLLLVLGMGGTNE